MGFFNGVMAPGPSLVSIMSPSGSFSSRELSHSFRSLRAKNREELCWSRVILTKSLTLPRPPSAPMTYFVVMSLCSPLTSFTLAVTPPSDLGEALKCDPVLDLSVSLVQLVLKALLGQVL